MTDAKNEMAPNTLQRDGASTEGDQRIDSTAILLGVEDVLVTDRFRKDLGDVSELKASIVEIGLLNPITVREWHGGFRLVAGERRLTAFKALGLAEIPARVARDIADARDALVAERDENTARKEMLPSEKAALGIAIEEMEKPAAAERRNAALNKGASRSGPGTGTGIGSREIAAEAIGMSEPSYRRVKTLVALSTDADQPEEVQDAAREALADIDNGAPVRPGYDKVKEVRRTTESITTEQEAAKASPRLSQREEIAEYITSLAKKYPTLRIAFAKEGHLRYASESSLESAAYRAGVKWQHTEKSYAKHAAQSQDWLERSSMNLEVALDVLTHIDFSTITTEQAQEALQRIEGLPRQLNLYIRSLKEITNG